jgi:hypothetical protein
VPATRALPQAAVSLQNLYDYCRKVEHELASFGFDEQRLAIEALGIMVYANGREWRMNVRLPHVVESTTICSNCLQKTCARTRRPLHSAIKCAVVSGELEKR